MTLRNRAFLLEQKFANIYWQDFDPKQIEWCITDGHSDDQPERVIERWYKKFANVKFAQSDRSVLPFEAKANYTCDINACVCNMPSHDLVIITDPEIILPRRHCLREFVPLMINNKRVVHCNAWLMGMRDVGYFQTETSYFLGVSKAEYIKNGGVEESWARGFAVEFTDFLRRWPHGTIVAPFEVLHLYHPNPADKPENMDLFHNVSLPLIKKVGAHRPNEHNPAWQRPEMLKHHYEYKEVGQ
jgi:hypothetical protein